MKRRQEKRNVIVGTAVRPNAGIRAWYREKLLALTKEMTATVRRKTGARFPNLRKVRGEWSSIPLRK